MQLLGFLLAATVAGLAGITLFSWWSPPARSARVALAAVLGGLIGIRVGLFMGGVNPPQYDFGFYPLSQLIASIFGGISGAVAAGMLVQPAGKALVVSALDSPLLPAPAMPRRRIRPMQRWSIAILVVILAGSAFYSYLNPRRLPRVVLPAVDSAVIDPTQLVEGMTMAEVRATLGDPSLVAYDEDYSSWYYGVRAAAPIGAEGRVRAPLLKIIVDPNDHVQSWGFYHPITDQPLIATESRLQATRWLNARCGSGDGPRVLLAQDLTPGVTTSDEVLALFGSWSLQPWTEPHLRAIFAHPQPDGSQLLIYPVDHPSAMYLPVMYSEVAFDDDGRLRVWSYAGGC